MPCLKNKPSFSTGAVDAALVVGMAIPTEFWQQLSSGSISSSTSTQGLQSLGCGGSSCSCLAWVRVMFENKHLKVKPITFNEEAAFLVVMVTFPVVLWMAQCTWLYP